MTTVGVYYKQVSAALYYKHTGLSVSKKKLQIFVSRFLPSFHLILRAFKLYFKIFLFLIVKVLFYISNEWHDRVIELKLV